MADTKDSKSFDRKVVGVQVPLRAIQLKHRRGQGTLGTGSRYHLT